MSHHDLDTSRWRAPNNYREVESALEGISVFAPVAEEKEHLTASATFKCPQCGATTIYDVSSGGVACEHCGHTAKAHSKQVGRQAEEFEFTLETLSHADQGWGTSRKELHCDSCGADIAVSEGAITAVCPFCASNSVDVHQAPSDNLRPRFIIPFMVQPETTNSSAETWLGKGWFHPGELSLASVIERFNGIYLSFWTFDANIASDWKAEVGYERTERYRQNGEWKTRTVIDWRWESGTVHINIDDLIVPASTHVNRKILDRLLPYDLNKLVTYSPDYLAGWQAQGYDTTLPEAWEEGKERMRSRAKSACHSDIPTRHVRNFCMTAEFSDESWRYILLPVYVAAYKFEDKVYQIMVNGQTGVVAGQKPVAWWKIWLAIAAILSPGVMLGLIGLPLLLAGGIGIIPLIIGFILLVIGIIISVILYRKAVNSEAA
jgi:predicted RNA-binding Zn-ribbon protein involved in translation (DUF1610 family)